MQFIGRLRELSDGKPVGFKLCVGTRIDVLAMCKAMIDTGIRPDFIIVDGSEGGTGAATARIPGPHGHAPDRGAAHPAQRARWARDCATGSGSAPRARSAAGTTWSAAHPGRRLHHVGPRDDDGRRLHPGAEVPHRSLPHRRRDAESPLLPRPRPGHQGRARLPLPPGDRQGGRTDDRDARRPRTAGALAHDAPATHLTDRGHLLRIPLQLARARRAPHRPAARAGRATGSARTPRASAPPRSPSHPTGIM